MSDSSQADQATLRKLRMHLARLQGEVVPMESQSAKAQRKAEVARISGLIRPKKPASKAKPSKDKD